MKKFKIGEKVIVGQFLDRESGVYWNPKMENLIGKCGIVEDYLSDCIYAVSFKGIYEQSSIGVSGLWWYPETALKKPREEKLKRLLKNC